MLVWFTYFGAFDYSLITNSSHCILYQFHPRIMCFVLCVVGDDANVFVFLYEYIICSNLQHSSFLSSFFFLLSEDVFTGFHQVFENEITLYIECVLEHLLDGLMLRMLRYRETLRTCLMCWCFKFGTSIQLYLFYDSDNWWAYDIKNKYCLLVRSKLSTWQTWYQQILCFFQ